MTTTSRWRFGAGAASPANCAETTLHANSAPTFPKPNVAHSSTNQTKKKTQHHSPTHARKHYPLPDTPGRHHMHRQQHYTNDHCEDLELGVSEEGEVFWEVDVATVFGIRKKWR